MLVNGRQQNMSVHNIMKRNGCKLGRSGVSQLPQQPQEPRTFDQLHVLLKDCNTGKEVSGRGRLSRSHIKVWDKSCTYGTDMRRSHGKCKEAKIVSTEAKTILMG